MSETEPRAALLEALIARTTDWLTKGGLWNPDLMEKTKTGDLILDLREFLVEQEALAAPAVVREPVAWRYRMTDAEGSLWFYQDDKPNKVVVIEPLYSAPPDAEAPKNSG